MGGGGGGKKGGGGGGGAGIQGIQNSLGQQSQMFQGLGDWERQFLSEPYNIGNYYMDIATGGTGPQAASYGNFGYGTEGVTPYGGGGSVGSGPSGSGSLFGSGNPWVSGLESSLQQQNAALPGMQSYASTLQSEAGTEFGQAQSEFGTARGELGYAQNLRHQLANNGGLFPDQKALIQAQVNAGQNQVSQQLASEGLGSSTMGGELASEIGLQGAATGGQLIQGNLGAVNAAYGTANQAFSNANQASQISNLANGTALAGQSQFFQELASIGQQNLTAQSAFFQQAMSGYGSAGAALQNVLQPYGYQLQDYSQIESAALGNAQIQAGLAGQQASAQASGMSGLFSGLGSLLGGGSGGGGLLGGLGGLIGGGAGVGGGATLGGGIAAGAAGGGGGLIAGIGSALGALFCEVARTVYGIDSPDWLLFRDWILFRAPKPVRTAYVIHAYRVSRWIKGRWLLCRVIRWTMNMVLRVDSFTVKAAQR